MKKIICVTLALVVAWVGMCHILAHFDNRREQQGFCTKNGTIITFDGHKWGYEDDALTAGTHIEVVFDENYTLFDVTDDTILEVVPIN